MKKDKSICHFCGEVQNDLRCPRNTCGDLTKQVRYMTKNEIYDMARGNIISVTFTKKDGETRTMKCSLKDEYIVSEEKKESTLVRKPNDDVLPVWDLDKNAWRSFRIESVKGVEIWEQS